MGTPSSNVRISEDTNALLKSVVAAFPAFSQSQLADALLTEACKAALAQGPTLLPTVTYIRQRHGLPATDGESQHDEINKLHLELAELKRSLYSVGTHRMNEEAPPIQRLDPSQAQARRAAGK